MPAFTHSIARLDTELSCESSKLQKRELYVAGYRVVRLKIWTFPTEKKNTLGGKLVS